jgi:hypothetical protein
VALIRLEKLGLLRLPKKIVDRGGRPPLVREPELLSEQEYVTTMPAKVSCVLVESGPKSRLWNSLIAKFHYLGLATPVGRLLRYLVYGDEKLVGAISFSEGAWNIKTRNTILSSAGLSPGQIREAVIGNNRFLILPTTRVPNLASRVLAESVRTARQDWKIRYGIAPIIAETFVDPRRFEGTCYRAANWLVIGATKGFAKRGCCHTNEHAPKLLLLRGLTPGIHQRIEDIVVGFKRNAA